MMGQKETTMAVATEEKGGGTLLRRMILVLTVATIMMLASSVPAFAYPFGGGQGGTGCGYGTCVVGGFNYQRNTGEFLGHENFLTHPYRYAHP